MPWSGGIKKKSPATKLYPTAGSTPAGFAQHSPRAQTRCTCRKRTDGALRFPFPPLFRPKPCRASPEGWKEGVAAAAQPRRAPPCPSAASSRIFHRTSGDGAQRTLSLRQPASSQPAPHPRPLPSSASIAKLCPRPFLVGEGPPIPKRRARRACVSPLSPSLK